VRGGRLGARDAEQGTIRADAASKTGTDAVAARHRFLAASCYPMRDQHRRQEGILVSAMDDRQEWERAAEHSRRLAIVAAELGRRHPGQHISPLQSAEPAPLSESVALWYHEVPNV
jgi:hypothetical protein